MELTATSPDLANVRLVVVVVVVEVVGVAVMVVMVVMAVMAEMAETTGVAMREEAVAPRMAVPARHRRNWIRRWRTTGVEITPRPKLLRSNPKLPPPKRRLPQPPRLHRPLLRLLPLMTIST
jgi:hypothetical protein